MNIMVRTDECQALSSVGRGFPQNEPQNEDFFLNPPLFKFELSEVKGDKLSIDTNDIIVGDVIDKSSSVELS